MTIALELKQLTKTYPGGVQALRESICRWKQGIFMRCSALTGREIHHDWHYQFAGE
jgi:hypothetical protein